MTPAKFKRGREALGLSQKGLAEVFKVQSDRTIRKWEAGERAIPGPAVVLMTYWLQSGVKFAKVADTWLLQGGDVRDDWF